MSNLSQFSRTIPLGGIIMWSGSTAPEGWQVCDGSDLPNTSPLRKENYGSLTKTPDLRDRFIVGAGSNYAIGNIGGESTVTLNINQMPQHDHLVYGQDNNAVGTGNVSNEVANVADRNGANAFFSRTTSLSGGNQAHENRPPYYALAFIMRIA
jgi:microcystin-dependent protein